MKICFYRDLLSWDGAITPTERIVYNFLLMKSISSFNDIYNKDGDGLDYDALNECLELNDNKLDLFTISYRKLSEVLNISTASVYNALKRLNDMGIVGDDWIKCCITTPKSGYFLLRMDLKEKLKGKLLVFYSWLCDKAKDGMLEIKRDTMAKCFGEPQDVGKRNIHNMMQRLYELGYIRREAISTGEYGKIQLLK